MIKQKSHNEMRRKRHLRIRRHIVGSADMPRLSVFRSDRHIYAQIIDDGKGITLVSASSVDKDLKLENGGNKEAARKVGDLLGRRAVAQAVSRVVFDRGGYLYHGRIKTLAESARAAGLKF